MKELRQKHAITNYNKGSNAKEQSTVHTYNGGLIIYKLQKFPEELIFVLRMANGGTVCLVLQIFMQALSVKPLK